jgi:glutathione S-transferase
MPAKLYVINGSHPCAAVERAMELKGMPYRTVEYIPPLHAPLQRLRFGVRTVPAIRFEDGEKVSGSRAIVRRLEELVPSPPLFPADPAARARVEEAERWGDESLQPVARRLIWPAFGRAPQALRSYQAGSKWPALPAPALRAMAPAVTFVEKRLNAASEDATRADLRALPDHLDRVDAWIGEGVLGGEQPNAADLQIAATVRLLLTIGDVRPLVEGRAAAELALRLFPKPPGEIPAGTYPAGWLAGSSR